MSLQVFFYFVLPAVFIAIGAVATFTPIAPRVKAKDEMHVSQSAQELSQTAETGGAVISDGPLTEEEVVARMSANVGAFDEIARKHFATVNIPNAGPRGKVESPEVVQPSFPMRSSSVLDTDMRKPNAGFVVPMGIENGVRLVKFVSGKTTVLSPSIVGSEAMIEKFYGSLAPPAAPPQDEKNVS